MAPPELAGDAPGLDVAHPGEEGVLPLLRHEAHARRSRPPRSPASPASRHRSTTGQVSRGSIGTPPRSPCGTWLVCGSIFSSSSSSSSFATIALRAAKRSWPARPRTKSGSATPSIARRSASISVQRHPRLGVEHGRHRHAVPLADLEVVEVMRRGDLHRAGALLRVGVVVGHHRDRAADQRQDHPLADQRGEARIAPDAPRRRCRPASSPAGWWRR